MRGIESKMSMKDIKLFDIKLLSREELLAVEPGAMIDCDRLHQSLLHAGFNASYENICSDAAGSVVLFYNDGERIGVVEGDDMGHMVRCWTLDK